MAINGVPVIPTVTAIARGFEVCWWNWLGFADGQVVTARIIAADTEGNVLDGSWTFTVASHPEVGVEMMGELASMGAEIQACGTCAKFRGVKKADIIEGTKLGGMAVLTNFANSCDRFLSFGF